MSTGASSTGRSAAPLGIVELGDVCARHRALDLDLFEQLGALVTADTTTPGADQQLFATACHRHLEHAELWAGRAPTIPPVDLDASVDAHRGDVVVTDVASYRATVAALVRELESLLDRVDPLLDPSTHRTVTRVLADLR